MYLLQTAWDPASDGIALFGNFKIHYYSLMWMAAFVVGWYLMKKIYFITVLMFSSLIFSQTTIKKPRLAPGLWCCGLKFISSGQNSSKPFQSRHVLTKNCSEIIKGTLLCSKREPTSVF